LGFWEYEIMPAMRVYLGMYLDEYPDQSMATSLIPFKQVFDIHPVNGPYNKAKFS